MFSCFLGLKKKRGDIFGWLFLPSGSFAIMLNGSILMVSFFFLSYSVLSFFLRIWPDMGGREQDPQSRAHKVD